MSDTLNVGDRLGTGQSLTSANGAYTLTLQDDGNLVLTDEGNAVWSTKTNGKGVVRASVQDDGNFVLYNGSDEGIWSTKTSGAGARLVLQDDRNVVLYIGDKGEWSSKTVTDKPIKYVVLTHYHAVRVLGASAYQPQQIIASQDTYDLIVDTAGGAFDFLGSGFGAMLDGLGAGAAEDARRRGDFKVAPIAGCASAQIEPPWFSTTTGGCWWCANAARRYSSSPAARSSRGRPPRRPWSVRSARNSVPGC